MSEKEREEEDKTARSLHPVFFQVFRVGNMCRRVFLDPQIPNTYFVGPPLYDYQSRWTVDEMKKYKEYIREAQANNKHAEITKLLGDILMGIKHLVHQKDREDVAEFANVVVKDKKDEKQ